MSTIYSDLLPGKQFPEMKKLIRIGYNRTRKLAWLDLRNTPHLMNGDQEDGVRRFLIGGVFKHPSWQPIQLGDITGGQYVSLSSEFSDPYKVVDFQQAIVASWVGFGSGSKVANLSTFAKGTAFGKSLKSLTSASFVAKALKTGFDAIGKPRSAGPKFTSWSIDDLLSYAKGRAPAVRDAALIDFKEFAPDPSFRGPGYKEERMRHKDTRDLPRIDSAGRFAHFAGPYPYANELEEINKGAIPFPRVIAYGFRGETRGPGSIKGAGGFLPNYTRPAHIERHEEKLKKAMNGGKFNVAALRELTEAETGALRLKEFLRDPTFKGFVSTTKSIAIAKHFATSSWNASAVPTDGQVDGWIYACLMIGAFEVPPVGEHAWAFMDEQEMTMPGMIDWENVVACRQVRKTGELHGPVYMRPSLRTDKAAAKTIWRLLSGMRQG
jgi:hypothetical protein